MTEKKKIGRPAKVPKPGTRVSLGLKVTPAIKERLDAAASASGRTQSQEAEARLERTFIEETDFGGPEVLNMARLMAAAFLRGGQRGASASGHSDWTPSEWVNDPFCYDAAEQAVADALNFAQPTVYKPDHPSPDQSNLQERIHQTFATLTARGADIKKNSK